MFAINGGANVPFTTAVFDGTFTEGRDYLVYTGISGDSFSIVGGGNDNDNRSGIHGFEIVGRIPEPASGLLLGLAFALAGIFGRRSR